MVNGTAIGDVIWRTSRSRVVFDCCEPDTPVTETWTLTGVAFAAAENVNESLCPTVNVSDDGETVTPEGNPLAVTDIDPEKPFPDSACTCTLCVEVWDKSI